MRSVAQAETNSTESFRGRTYRIAGVRYATGIGHSCEDDYAVIIDPGTNRPALIQHSVTASADVDRVTCPFDEWQRVSGLSVPARLTFYAAWTSAGNRPIP